MAAHFSGRRDAGAAVFDKDVALWCATAAVLAFLLARRWPAQSLTEVERRDLALPIVAVMLVIACLTNNATPR